ncbi:MAG: CHASE domain-containing protein [Actinomycetota bacterium]
MTAVQWAKRKRLATAVTFVIVLLLGTIVGLTLDQSITTSKRSAAQAMAFTHAQRLVQRLEDAMAPAYMLAALVQAGGGRVDNFDAAGEQLLQTFPMARAVQLAPGGVIRQSYPLQGNEKAIGHDLLKDRDRNREAHVAVASRQLTVAGPFNLVQGGIGAVGRYPLFLADRSGRESFWGFTTVLVRVPELLNTAGILDLSREGYRYELCRIPPNGSECEVFARSGEGRPESPVIVPVDVPNGRWQLALAPEDGWLTRSEKLLIAGAVLLVAALLGGLQYLFLRNLQRAA